MLKKFICFSSNTLVVIFSISVANFPSARYAASPAIFQIKCSLVNVMNRFLQTKFKKANVMTDLIRRTSSYLNGMFFNTLENVPFRATKLVDTSLLWLTLISTHVRCTAIKIFNLYFYEYVVNIK